MKNHGATGLFSNRNFRFYFAARIVSQLGDQMYLFAVGWYVMAETGSSFHMAALLALNSLMTMVVSPFAGLVSDRISRKKVMVVTDLIQGIVVLALIAARQGGLALEALYAAAVVLGLCSAVFSPAAGAIVPGIVGMEHVGAAVAAGQAAGNLCIVAGMMLGGTLYRLIGITGVLALNAASNLVAAGMETRIRTAPFPGPGGTRPSAVGVLARFISDMRDGLRYVRGDGKLLGYLLINTAFSFVVLPIPMVYMPHFFNLVLGASPVQAAAAQAGSWVGIILGSALASRLLRRRRPEPIIGGGLLAISATTFLFVLILWSRKWVGAAWLTGICALSNTLAGMSGALFVVPVYAYFHTHGREEFRGRFWGLEAALRTAATCAGFISAGLLARRISLSLIFALTAILMFALFIQVARSSTGVEAGADEPTSTKASA